VGRRPAQSRAAGVMSETKSSCRVIDDVLDPLRGDALQGSFLSDPQMERQNEFYDAALRFGVSFEEAFRMRLRDMTVSAGIDQVMARTTRLAVKRSNVMLTGVIAACLALLIIVLDYFGVSPLSPRWSHKWTVGLLFAFVFVASAIAANLKGK
jgi:hypothetical protein